jgi:hypothetical protein
MARNTPKPQTLAAALGRVRKGMAYAPRNQDGDGYTWADLASVLAVCEDRLRRQGVDWLQYPVLAPQPSGPTFCGVTTRLVLRATGEVLEATAGITLPSNRLDYAGAITALRRIGLACMVGVVVEEEGAQRFDAKTGENAAQKAVRERREAVTLTMDGATRAIIAAATRPPKAGEEPPL